MKSLNGNRVYDGDCAEESYHEIGHLYALTFYGINVESVEVGDNFGRTRLPAQDVEAIHYIVTLCAGKAAVDRWYGYKTLNDEAWRESKDHGRAYEAALKVSNGDHKAALLLMRWAQRMADCLVEAHWHELHEPARLLAERGKLTLRVA